ncbi:MAG: 2-phosphosulfolactate phosphatase [Candidatus Bathyarchaeota archaeon]|nr:2-phosphosulfolactate phosphatase [Candidatus Bathyarchaeota archaeon]MCZ2845539.1 2-phosphosulfolactate phosphatase [Candidatus Bathyarchaeota archaeon]
MIEVNLELSIEKGREAVKRNDIAIVIDALRCSSTIITALANDVREIIPVETLDEAFKMRSNDSNIILVGERKGQKIDGFDLDNSPLKFITNEFRGKRIVITTTNGTSAIKQVEKCPMVLIGAFMNSNEVTKKALILAQKYQSGITILLAGRNHNFFLEDFLCAGLLSSKFKYANANLNDHALASMLSWERAECNIREIVKNSQHGRNLIEIGLEKDVDFCLNIDAFSVVPYLERNSIKIFSEGKI